MSDNVVDLTGKAKGTKRPGRKMKETPADEQVRQQVLENSGARLSAIVVDLEELADKMAEVRATIKAKLDGAKAEGYSPAAIRGVLKRRAATAEALAAAEELDAVVGTYWEALMVADES